MKKFNGYIYRIYCKKNKKSYIGRSVNLERRWNCYTQLLCESQPKLYNCLKKYGIKSMVFTVLEYIESNDYEKLIKRLTSLEKKLIKKYDSFKNGMNATKGE